MAAAIRSSDSSQESQSSQNQSWRRKRVLSWRSKSEVEKENVDLRQENQCLKESVETHRRLIDVTVKMLTEVRS